MSREVLKVFCPRNHRVGTVVADGQGLRIDYDSEVHHTTGIFGAPYRMRLGEGDVTGFAAYCKVCMKSVGLSVQGLRAAAHADRRHLHAPYSDTSDHIWTDAGHPPMYPPGTTRHKHDPRSNT